MNLRKLAVLAVTALVVIAPATPAFAVSKEIVQLETQVQDLADRIAHMQQSFDEQMGVMKNLVTQSTDNVNKLSDAVQSTEKTLAQQNTDSQTKVDQVSGQIQALNDSIDELRARLEKTSKQLEDIQSQQQSILMQQAQQAQQPATQPAAGTLPTGEQPAGGQPTGAPGGDRLPVPVTTPVPAAIQAPPPDVLYNNALRDYNAARYDLSLSQFQDYLKYYASTDLAGNAQFYIADIEYHTGNFEAAVTDYDKVIEDYPSGNKAASAGLKKGYALLELGHKDAGIRELNALIQRYPHSIEATQARERLHKLGASNTRPGKTHKPQY